LPKHGATLVRGAIEGPSTTPSSTPEPPEAPAVNLHLLYQKCLHYLGPQLCLGRYDETVRGKGSLFGMMAGDEWQKHANLRLLFGYMYGMLGKKLLFMGDELAQWPEWNHEASIEWHVTGSYNPHATSGQEMAAGRQEQQNRRQRLGIRFQNHSLPCILHGAHLGSLHFVPTLP